MNGHQFVFIEAATRSLQEASFMQILAGRLPVQLTGGLRAFPKRSNVLYRDELGILERVPKGAVLLHNSKYALILFEFEGGEIPPYSLNEERIKKILPSSAKKWVVGQYPTKILLPLIEAAKNFTGQKKLTSDRGEYSPLTWVAAIKTGDMMGPPDPNWINILLDASPEDQAEIAGEVLSDLPIKLLKKRKAAL